MHPMTSGNIVEAAKIRTPLYSSHAVVVPLWWISGVPQFTLSIMGIQNTEKLMIHTFSYAASTTDLTPVGKRFRTHSYMSSCVK